MKPIRTIVGAVGACLLLGGCTVHDHHHYPAAHCDRAPVRSPQPTSAVTQITPGGSGAVTTRVTATQHADVTFLPPVVTSQTNVHCEDCPPEDHAGHGGGGG